LSWSLASTNDSVVSSGAMHTLAARGDRRLSRKGFFEKRILMSTLGSLLVAAGRHKKCPMRSFFSPLA
jgi:hypothetical protein